MKVSRSSYYEHLAGTVSKRAQENEHILSLIKQVHKKSKQRGPQSGLGQRAMGVLEFMQLCKQNKYGFLGLG
jgi:hypothetical protein